MTVVWHLTLVLVLQVHWVNVESISNFPAQVKKESSKVKKGEQTEVEGVTTIRLH